MIFSQQICIQYTSGATIHIRKKCQIKIRQSLVRSIHLIMASSRYVAPPIFLYIYTYIQCCLHTSRNSSSRFVTDIEYASCILTFENPFNCASVLSISIVRCSTGWSGASTHANSRYRYIDRYMGARSIDSFCRQMNS